MKNKTDEGRFIYVLLDPVKLPASDTSLNHRDWSESLYAGLTHKTIRYFEENRDRIEGDIRISIHNKASVFSGLSCHKTMAEANRYYERSRHNERDRINLFLHGNWIDSAVPEGGSTPLSGKTVNAPPEAKTSTTAVEQTRPVFAPQEKPLHTFLAGSDFMGSDYSPTEAAAAVAAEKAAETGSKLQYPEAFDVKIASKERPVCTDYSLTAPGRKGRNSWRCSVKTTFWVTSSATPRPGVPYTTTEPAGPANTQTGSGGRSMNFDALRLRADAKPTDAKSAPPRENSAATDKGRDGVGKDAAQASASTVKEVYKYTRQIDYAGAMLAPTRDAAIASAGQQRAREEPSYRTFASAIAFSVVSEGEPDCINNPVNRRKAFKDDNWICTIRVTYQIESHQQPNAGAASSSSSRAVAK